MDSNFHVCRYNVLFQSAIDVGSISNLGARLFEGTFSLKKGAFFEKGTSLFLATSWGHVPQVPLVPTSMIFSVYIVMGL